MIFGASMKAKNEILWTEIETVQKCDWNYKLDGSEEEMEKLKNSVSRDNSVGVLPVRVVDVNGTRMFEVIDGNHRLQALQELGWKKVPIENFGEISKADAITIARRRNEEWFDSDPFKYAELLRDEVMGTYSLEELSRFMPETEDQMKAMIESLDFNFDDFGKDKAQTNDGVPMRHITLSTPEETAVEFEEDLKDFLKQYPDVEMK